MKNIEDTTLGEWEENIWDPGDYPDGFDPELYDL